VTVSAADADRIRALVADAAATDGVAALGGHVLERLPEGDFLLRTQGSELVAVAAVSADDPAEVVVAPAHRGAGIGHSLVAEALGPTGGVWAHGDLPAAAAVASDLGLRRSRELLQLSRPLAGMADETAHWPDGVALRTFRPGIDDDEFLAVNARAFAWHPEQGRLDAAGLAVEMAQDWFDPAGFFLAVADPAEGGDGRILGFHWTKVHAATPAEAAIGEVYVIAVDPRSTVRRLGSPLTVVGLQHLAAQGLPAVMLYVEGDNAPARKLYDGWGFTISRTDVVYRR
jgi:mycothiol synthase